MSIQDQIKSAMIRLHADFLARTGIKNASWTCKVEMNSFNLDKADITVSVRAGWGENAASVYVSGYELALALAAQRVATLRTYADECADLYAGLNEDAA